MAYLIPTDWRNLQKTIKHGIIRIPKTLRGRYDLRRVGKEDRVFLFDHENGRVYGPVLPLTGVVREERNPRSGPFNGTGKAEKHYLYDSLGVDCSGMWKEGVPVDELNGSIDEKTFSLSIDEESFIIETLKVANEGVPSIVINFDSWGERVNVTVIEVSKGMNISHHAFGLTESVLSLMARRKRAAEYRAVRGDWKGVEQLLREMGTAVYDNILERIGLSGVFCGGERSIYISGDERSASIPFEIAYMDAFIFENNLLTFRGERRKGGGSAVVKRVLLLSDPGGRYRWAYKEGMALYGFFKSVGCPVDFISRPIRKEMMLELFAQYDIIHFSGHSDGLEAESGWNLGRSTFSADDVGVQRKVPYLIFSSACGSTLKMGFDLLRLGTLNCVSSRWRIPDRDISGFLLDFYSLLLRKSEIGVAFHHSLLNSYRRGDILPLMFVLQGEPRIIYEPQNT